jgi:hypothetical protein
VWGGTKNTHYLMINHSKPAITAYFGGNWPKTYTVTASILRIRTAAVKRFYSAKWLTYSRCFEDVQTLHVTFSVRLNGLEKARNGYVTGKNNESDDIASGKKIRAG